jgi:hypothetical protein
MALPLALALLVLSSENAPGWKVKAAVATADAKKETSIVQVLESEVESKNKRPQQSCAEAPQKIYEDGGKWTAPRRLCNMQSSQLKAQGVSFSAPCDRKWVPEGIVCSRVCEQGLASDPVPIMCGQDSSKCEAAHEELDTSLEELKGWHASEYNSYRCEVLDEVPVCKLVAGTKSGTDEDTVEFVPDEKGGIHRNNWQRHCEMQRGAPNDWQWSPATCSFGGSSNDTSASESTGLNVRARSTGVDPTAICKGLTGNVLFVGDSLSSMMKAAMLWLMNPVSHYKRRKKGGGAGYIDACDKVGTPFGKNLSNGFHLAQVCTAPGLIPRCVMFVRNDILGIQRQYTNASALDFIGDVFAPESGRGEEEEEQREFYKSRALRFSGGAGSTNGSPNGSPDDPDAACFTGALREGCACFVGDHRGRPGNFVCNPWADADWLVGRAGVGESVQSV